MNFPGHGVIERPEQLKIKDRAASAQLPFDWSQIKEDSVGVIPNLFGITDQDQNGSSTCTVQATRYGFKYAAKLDIGVQPIYCHIFLPGGGAYLNAPLDYARNNGVVLQSKYPDPNPETEQAMEHIITVKDGDKIRTFTLTYTFYPADIDSAASAIQNHSYIHLGIRGSWSKGWDKTWVDPQYEGQNDWQHALFAGKESIVLRNGIPTIKAKSSWCQHKDIAGNQVYCHYLNKNYFSNNGVFEIIGVDLKEIIMFQKVVKQDGKTFGVKISTPNIDTILYADSAEQWISWSKSDSYALNTTNADGSANFDTTDVVKLPF